MTFNTKFMDNQLAFGSGSKIDADDIPDGTNNYFLTTGSQDISGSKTFREDVYVDGNLYIGYATIGDVSLYFHRTDGRFWWQAASSSFVFDDNVRLASGKTLTVETTFKASKIISYDVITARSDIYIDDDANNNDSYLYFHGTDAYLNWDNVNSHFELNHELNVADHTFVSGDIYADGDMFVDWNQSANVSYLYFRGTTAYLKWNNVSSQFDFSHKLQISASGSQLGATQINGDLQVSGNIIGNITDTTFGDITVNTITASASGSQLNATQINGKLHTTDDIYINGNNIYFNHDGGNIDQYIYFYRNGATGRSLKWNSWGDRFEFNDTLWVDNGFKVSGECRCNSFRIDQVPAGEAVRPDTNIIISCNGTDYYVPILAV